MAASHCEHPQPRGACYRAGATTSTTFRHGDHVLRFSVSVLKSANCNLLWNGYVKDYSAGALRT
jgi:hypothetical protein